MNTTPQPMRLRPERPGHNARLCATGSASARRGLTLVEVVAATLIVGLMSVAALNSLGAATRSAEWTGNRAVAVGLADQLMTEILGTAYQEVDEAVAFGPEASELDGSRNLFDDVDDYHSLSEQPPTYRDGTSHANRNDWRRRVSVAYVDPDTLETTNDDLGAKRITVVVEYRTQKLAEQVAIRTDYK